MVATIFFPLLKAFGLFLKFTYPISEYVLNFVYRLCMGPNKTLPPIEDETLLLPATELAGKIRKKQLRCQDVMRAYIQRSKLIHPFINAAVDERYEEALKEAQEVDRFLESGEKSEGDIALGVPFSCKEMIGIKGLAQTNGLVRAKGHVADEDSHAAAEYRKAGAIPIVVTNVPELSMWWDTANLVFGRTRNPYDNRRSVGGSTGGEGALLSSAGAAMGIGTDIGGSIRIPSAFNGIYGHKPSRGIVSNWGTYPYCFMNPERKDVRPVVKFVSTGPMCRHATDLPLLLKVMSGYDRRLKLDAQVDFRKVKVYYMDEIPGIAVCGDLKKAITKAARYFEDEYDVQAIPVTLQELKYGLRIWLSKFQEVKSAPLAKALAGENKSINLWWEMLKSIFRCADHTLPSIFFGILNQQIKEEPFRAMLRKYDDLEQKLSLMFEEDSILLFPTMPEPPPLYLISLSKLEHLCYTAVINILGYPSTAIPAGLSNGLPISIQAVSGPFKDHLTIAAAIELDKVFGGWMSPCPIKI